MKNLEPKEVFSIFEQITQVPRPSKHEERISQWLVDFAAAHGIGDHVPPDVSGEVKLHALKSFLLSFMARQTQGAAGARQR